MSKSIKCTKCGTDIDLKDALYEELKSDFDNDVEIKVASKTRDLTGQLKYINNSLEKYMSEAGESKAKVTELQFKLQNVNTTIKEEYKSKLLEEKVNVQIEANKSIEIITRTAEEKAELKVQEKLDVIEQLKKQLSVAQQKAEQGSMQTQGEAQEVLIEEYLRIEFPLDTISEIKKGAMGADSLQVVNSRISTRLGSIYYESKRTKTFNSGWIEKFKKDMREKGADIGVIVSSARPPGVERAIMLKGVWICTLDEFKVLSYSLRDTICKLFDIKGIQENKGDKMELLYSYLTSNEFKLQIDAIIEGFSQMQIDLDTEKRSMLMSWNRREKQIKKVIESTAGMYGSIKGIGGTEIKDVPSLQLEQNDE